MQWILSLTPECGPDPMALLAQPPEEASLVEVRLDLFPDLDPLTAVAVSPRPLLLTLRSQREGGRGPNDPKERQERLKSAYRAGPALLDLEFVRDEALLRDLGMSPERCLFSFHDPHGVPKDIDSLASKMLEKSAALIKIISSPSRISDLGKILSLFRLKGNGRAQSRRRLIAFGMGSVGLPTRFLSPLLGAPISFVSWQRGAAAAPGQKTAWEMDAVCGHLSGPPQRLFGVVGSDVSESLSPILHAAAYRKLGLPYLFVPLSLPNPDDLDEIFRPAGCGFFDRLDLPTGGWAVTRPYKEPAARAADFQAPRVLRAGAANTLILKPDRIIAENTDADGVTGSLMAAKIQVEGKQALIQGYGGAARGAAVGLDLGGATVFLRGRDAVKTARVAKTLGIDVGRKGIRADILINATPLGRHPGDPLPFSKDEVQASQAVVDMVYGDHETELIRLAKELGKTTVEGREMLAYQGMAQFAAMTTQIPPRAEMLEALKLTPLTSPAQASFKPDESS